MAHLLETMYCGNVSRHCRGGYEWVEIMRQLDSAKSVPPASQAPSYEGT